MNKKLLILAVAGLALASCSNDEVVESAATSDANAISFRPFVNNVTRATDITVTTLESSGFTVFANVAGEDNNYFGETLYTWDGTASYTSANKHYWPSSGSLDFYAYALNGSSTVTHTANTKVFTITPASAAASQSDFVFACTKGKGKTGTYDPDDVYNSESLSKTSQYGNNGVPLNFRHAMSKVTVKFKNTNPNIYVTVKDVTIGYLNTVGTYTYSGSTSTQASTDNNNTYNLKYGDWSDQSGAGSYTQTLSEGFSSGTAVTALPTSFILVPQTLTASTTYSAATADSPFNGAYIKAQIKIQNGSTSSGAYIIGGEGDNYVTALWPLQSIEWDPGYHYIYTVDLAGGGYFDINHDDDAELDPILEGAEIRFVTVTVDGWDTANYTVGNMVFAKGGTHAANIVAEAGEYTITITGLASAESISSVTTSVGSVSYASGTAGTDGTFSFGLTVPATGSSRTVSVVVTGATSGTTTINLTQAAP